MPCSGYGRRPEAQSELHFQEGKNMPSWDKEKARAYSAARYAANREKMRAQSAAWRLSNPEKDRATKAAYRAAHPDEKGAGRAAAWNAAHPAERAATGAKRRALKRSATIGDTKAIAAIYRRAREAKNVKCYLCGELIPLGERHVDHVVPLCKGGPHSGRNLAITHAKCNLSKRAKHPSEIGLLL
jgi:5-methylcytosine-specific restriction endonuclease McrA